MNVVLLIPQYISSDARRMQEIQYCFDMNIVNPHVTKVLHLADGRPTYNYCFELMRKEEANSKAIFVLVNSDIYFLPQTFQMLHLWQQQNNTDKLCFALTPYDKKADGFVEFRNRADSQDAWIFFGAPPRIMGANFTQGRAGCDNKIAYLLQHAGYRVHNPSLDLRCIHEHVSDTRNYITPALNPDSYFKTRIPPPYLLLHPCRLSDVK